MVGLLDIAPSTRTVRVEGNDVAVYGVSAQGIAYLLQRFPALREMIGKGSMPSPEQIVEMVPDAIAAVIAAGTGYPNNTEAEAVAAKLSADTQLDLLKTIIELTMPKGVGPFVEKLTVALSGLDVQVKAPPTPSPPPSSA